jgi:hypothetical protein
MIKTKPGLQPRLTPSDLDIAWAAGVYEGEGSCSKGGHGKRSFVLSVAQKDPEVLYRLRDLFGGSVREYPNNRGNLATGNQPFTIFAWRLCGDGARMFVAMTYSYLTARRKQQVDDTRIREFLDYVGNVPREGAFAFVSAKMNERTRRKHENSVARRKQYEKDFHEQHKSDPAYMEKRREQTRNWRAKQKSKVVSIA